MLRNRQQREKAQVQVVSEQLASASTTMVSESDALLSQQRKPSLYEPKSKFVDHFSLESPSDTIRFRRTAVRVYSSGTQQFQIVEQDDEKDDKQHSFFKAKVTSDGSSGLSLLRAAYTLVTVLMMGFLLIFCLQVLLFLFVSLVVEGGLSSKQRLNVFHLLGTILSIPIFVFGLASALTIATEFVHDTWQGHCFFRSVLRWSPVFIDWMAFVLFLGIPLVVMLNLMFTDEHWWETTALIWIGCVTVSFGLFCLAVFVFEIWGALELLSHHPKYGLREASLSQVGKFLKQAILLRQRHRFAGVRHRTFYMEGSQELPNPNESYDASEVADHEFTHEQVTWYSQLTLRMPETWFTPETPPVRQYNVEDVLDRTVFVTDASWNLEKLFCRRKKARAVVVVNGPSRITKAQVISSMACAILGNMLLLALVAAFLRWMGMSIPAILAVAALVLVLNRDTVRRIYVVYDTYRDTNQAAMASDVNTGSKAIYQVTETHRVTRPTEKLCWISFIVEIVLLFAFPLWMLVDIGNNAIALLFLILGFFSAGRHYFSVPAVLSELGSLDLLDGDFIRERSSEADTDVDDDEEDWREKNRLSKIVAKISQGARRDVWIKFITAFVVIFMLLFLYAFAGGSNSGGTNDTSNLLDDFRYVPDDRTFKYPTCSMTADFSIPGSNSTAMADYAYLASIAYTSPESMPALLDTWFGEGVAFDDVKTVAKFGVQYAMDSAVHYKLITFASNPDFAVVTIRGTK